VKDGTILIVGVLIILALASAWLLVTLPSPSLGAEMRCGGQQGLASWYSYTGHRTASGRMYTGREMTAAHRTLAFGSRVRVTDMRTGRSIVVTIDDRGPWVRGRVIDLSPVARNALGMGGLASVCLTVIP
jgi:rare lipoprotein A